MRTLVEVKKEMLEIQSIEYKKKSLVTKAKNRLQFLKIVELYLEGIPDEYFIVREIFKLETLINNLSERYDESKYCTFKSPKKKFEDEFGITK